MLERSSSQLNVIAFSHLRWDFVWQRPQQILSRIALHHPVLFVEEPVLDAETGRDPYIEVVHAADTNVVRLIAHAAPGSDVQALQDSRLAYLRAAAAERPPILWYYNPMDAHWSIDNFQSHAIVYDCMDELSLFKDAPGSLAQEESKLLKRAHIVFAGGKELAEAKRKQHDNVHFFGCGVDFHHFALAQNKSLPVAPEMERLPSPVIGWFGVIDERMDCELIAAMAAARPNWSFVLIGPVVKIDPDTLPLAQNIHWLGAKSYKELPDYCRGFDVCMMPFALNDATRYINPTKALEYLSTGLPVVSTPITDVVSQYADCVAIASSAQEFILSIESSLASSCSEKQRIGYERARASSWEETVARMLTLISQSFQRQTQHEAAMAFQRGRVMS